jgi:hypothetical protein
MIVGADYAVGSLRPYIRPLGTPQLTMLTRKLVLEQIDHYLNRQITLAQLVDWAENALMEPTSPTNEDADTIMDVVSYLGAADTRGFPLTWDRLDDFIERLGGRVLVRVQSV